MLSAINLIINKFKAKHYCETFNTDINYANNYLSNAGDETMHAKNATY